jgi:hypothetical protein
VVCVPSIHQQNHSLKKSQIRPLQYTNVGSSTIPTLYLTLSRLNIFSGRCNRNGMQQHETRVKDSYYSNIGVYQQSSLGMPGGVPNEGNAAVRPRPDALVTHHRHHNASSAENESETSTPSRVILSFRNNYYKDTMWRYFRMLGKTRDRDRETQIGNEIFSLFKQKVGETGRFFKYEGNRVIEANDERALKSE